jgi:hypothetical protein
MWRMRALALRMLRRMRKWGIIARSRPARIAGWTLAAILTLVAVAAYGVALWRAPSWMHATTAQDRYNARVLVISVGGAIVVGAGLLYTARNYRLSRRGQVTDRFTIALERLGSSELYVRIGGVHALEHVMRDSADHHDDVIEVLTEFIRKGAPRRSRQSGRQVWMHPVTGSVPDLPYRPAPDIQAALTALSQRPRRPERPAAGSTRPAERELRAHPAEAKSGNARYGFLRHAAVLPHHAAAARRLALPAEHANAIQSRAVSPPGCRPRVRRPPPLRSARV